MPKLALIKIGGSEFLLPAKVDAGKILAALSQAEHVESRGYGRDEVFFSCGRDRFLLWPHRATLRGRPPSTPARSRRQWRRRPPPQRLITMPAPGFKMIRLIPAGIARRAAARRALLDEEVARMFAAYQTGLSLAEVGRAFGGRCPTSVRSLFEARSLALRVTYRSTRAHRADGCFSAAVLLTDAEAHALADAATDLRVPPALRLTWRKWSLERRAIHLARIRDRLGKYKLPPGPFSPNVTPWDYATPAAQEIARRQNIGTTSQTKNAQIKTNSCGVIFEGGLWFYHGKIGYKRGAHSRQKLELLHHTIWSRAHGRPVPRSHVVRHRDGNPNNLTPENLHLVHRNELARANQARVLTAKSRALTSALLTRNQGTSDHATITHLRHSSVRR